MLAEQVANHPEHSNSNAEEEVKSALDLQDQLSAPSTADETVQNLPSQQLPDPLESLLTFSNHLSIECRHELLKIVKTASELDVLIGYQDETVWPPLNERFQLELRQLSHESLLQPGNQLSNMRLIWTLGCKSLDSLLNLEHHRFVEICGGPSTGKTQLGIQLSLNLINQGASILYIDTEASVVQSRVEEMKRANKFDNADLDKFYYCSLVDYRQLLSFVLDGHLENHVFKNKIKLIVIDSIAMPFRYNQPEPNVKTKLLLEICRQLSALAMRYHLKIIFLNQITTKRNCPPTVFAIPQHNPFSEGRPTDFIAPALSDLFGHVCTRRVMLLEHDTRRYAMLFKCSESVEPKTVRFQICANGLIDLQVDK